MLAETRMYVSWLHPFKIIFSLFDEIIVRELLLLIWLQDNFKEFSAPSI